MSTASLAGNHNGTVDGVPSLFRTFVSPFLLYRSCECSFPRPARTYSYARTGWLCPPRTTTYALENREFTLVGWARRWLDGALLTTRSSPRFRLHGRFPPFPSKAHEGWPQQLQERRGPLRRWLRSPTLRRCAQGPMGCRMLLLVLPCRQLAVLGCLLAVCLVVAVLALGV